MEYYLGLQIQDFPEFKTNAFKDIRGAVEIIQELYTRSLVDNIGKVSLYVKTADKLFEIPEALALDLDSDESVENIIKKELAKPKGLRDIAEIVIHA